MSRLVAAWDVEPGACLPDGRTVQAVRREPRRRVVTLTLETPTGLEWETWMGEAPLPITWQPGDPLPRRRPGAAWAALTRRLGL